MVPPISSSLGNDLVLGAHHGLSNLNNLSNLREWETKVAMSATSFFVKIQRFLGEAVRVVCRVRCAINFLLECNLFP